MPSLQELHSVSLDPPCRELDSDSLAEIIGACIEDQSLFIRYCSEIGEVTERAVTPLALMPPISTKNGYVRPWSMLAWCHRQDAVRVFFLPRVQALDLIPRLPLATTRVVQAVIDLQPANRRRLQTITYRSDRV